VLLLSAKSIIAVTAKRPFVVNLMVASVKNIANSVE